MQRNGTTSCGQFLRDCGFRVASYGISSPMRWSYHWLDGDYEAIFRSLAFRSFQAYEDDPWWSPDFYRQLFHRFPNSKFILFYRDSDKWFDSMLRHSQGKSVGNTYAHCKIYRRLDEFYDQLDHNEHFHPREKGVENLMSLKSKRDHYVGIYEEYNREVMEFFKKKDPSRLFVSRLEDDQKWIRLGEFLNKQVSPDYNVHIR